VCADVDGNVGWFTAGFTPVRQNWHGLLPVPGDGSHEWAGFLPVEELPRVVNPAAGFFATANEMNLPADRDPQAPTIGHEWAEVSRAARIKSVLASDTAHSTEASMALQMDTYSSPAARICALLVEATARKGAAVVPEKATALFDGWDFRLTADSNAA